MCTMRSWNVKSVITDYYNSNSNCNKWSWVIEYSFPHMCECVCVICNGFLPFLAQWVVWHYYLNRRVLNRSLRLHEWWTLCTQGDNFFFLAQTHKDREIRRSSFFFFCFSSLPRFFLSAWADEWAPFRCVSACLTCVRVSLSLARSVSLVYLCVLCAWAVMDHAKAELNNPYPYHHTYTHIHTFISTISKARSPFYFPLEGAFPLSVALSTQRSPEGKVR